MKLWMSFFFFFFRFPSKVITSDISDMDPINMERTSVCHAVAMPFPGRGHVNPMMCLCKLLASRRDDLLITFVVTEEWLGLIGSDSKPSNMRFASIPNVIPSEGGRAADYHGFIEAVLTKMEAPFERFLDEVEPLATIIIADIYLPWLVGVGNRRNIPVASFWTMSATMLSLFSHFDLLVQNGHFPMKLSVEGGKEPVDYIPGISSTHLADLPTIIYDSSQQRLLAYALNCVSGISKSQYLLFTTIYELEPQVIDTLRSKFTFPLYTVGPTVPYLKIGHNSSIATTTHNEPNYFHWLDLQPKSSVLYVSLGSFLSISNAQMDELVAGLQESGVRYVCVARGEKISCFKKGCSGDMGLVLPWCDQLKVLCHSSIGGFLSHCGWNSTLEALYAGVPLLTFPIFWDQVPNSKLIVQDLKIGWRVKKEEGLDCLVTREEIAKLVQRFMDLESNEGKEMRRRAREVRERCRGAIENFGSSITDLDAFINDIS